MSPDIWHTCISSPPTESNKSLPLWVIALVRKSSPDRFHPKEDLLCCQCMERVECIQKEDEPEWLAHLLIMNDWELDRSNLGLCGQFRTCFPLHFLFCFASFHNYWHSNVVYYNIHDWISPDLYYTCIFMSWIMICIFMSCVWGFTPLAVPLVCMAAVVQAYLSYSGTLRHGSSIKVVYIVVTLTSLCCSSANRIGIGFVLYESETNVFFEWSSAPPGNHVPAGSQSTHPL